MQAVGLLSRGKLYPLQQFGIALDTGHGGFQFVGKRAQELPLLLVHLRQCMDVLLDPVRHPVKTLGNLPDLVSPGPVYPSLVISVRNHICRVPQLVEGDQDPPNSQHQQRRQQDGENPRHSDPPVQKSPAGMKNFGHIPVMKQLNGTIALIEEQQPLPVQFFQIHRNRGALRNCVTLVLTGKRFRIFYVKYVRTAIVNLLSVIVQYGVSAETGAEHALRMILLFQ